MPPRLCTSPIPWGGLSGFPSDSQLGTASEPEGLIITGRRKRRRRRKPKRREDAVDSSSEELEAGAESELPSQEKPTAESPRWVGGRWRLWGTLAWVEAFLLWMLCNSGQGPWRLWSTARSPDRQISMPVTEHFSVLPKQCSGGGGVLTAAERHLPLLRWRVHPAGQVRGQWVTGCP